MGWVHALTAKTARKIPAIPNVFFMDKHYIGPIYFAPISEHWQRQRLQTSLDLAFQMPTHPTASVFGAEQLVGFGLKRLGVTEQLHQISLS